MMRQNILGLITVVLAAGLFSACSSGGGDNTAAAAPNPFLPVSPGGTVPSAPGSTTTSGNNSVKLLASSGALGGMFFQSGASNPQNITLSMNVSNTGAGYGGSVTISYTDSSGAHSSTLTTTHPSYASTSDAEYNVWLNATEWHGFFQDLYGAVVVVIDRSSSTGDGAVGTVGGSVYYQNFVQTGMQGPLKMCWQISIGPYDCRTFLTSIDNSSMPVTTSSLYPNNSGPNRPAYKLLGTFDGLNQAAALGN